MLPDTAYSTENGTFTRRKSTDSTTIHKHWTGLYRSTVPQSKRKFQANYAKVCVCIFICQDTRAVYLELLNSMTTEDFLQAFSRMAN